MPLIAYLTVATVFIGAPLIVQATPSRTIHMCDEVAYALNESVTFGTLTQEEANDIADRCYEVFT